MHPDIRFYAADVKPGFALLLPEEEAKHARVLRLKPGDTVFVINGRGGLFEASVSLAGKRIELQVTALVQQADKSTDPLWLAVAPTKNTARFEWMLEKSVEIGVDRIIPITCAHSERVRLNTDRLVRIAVSAMKQSKALWMPAIDELTAFRDILSLPASHKWIAHCDEKAVRQPLAALTTTPGGQLVCIGPEGDFSAGEIAQATAAGFLGLSLGTHRLRTETAALTACIAAALLRG